MTDPDAVWRRPSGDATPMEVVVPQAPPPSRYEGPPRAAPPPPGWSVPHLVNAAPPRALPAQDAAAAETAERQARTFTAGVGIMAGAVMVVALFVLLVRALT